MNWDDWVGNFKQNEPKIVTFPYMAIELDSLKVCVKCSFYTRLLLSV